MNNEQQGIQKIWLAGGCFWGVEAYFAKLDGVAETSVGYANGQTENPAYQDIPFSGHVETVAISYDPNIISLEKLLTHFFKIIDPTVENEQGPDKGTQYRTGIYYQNEMDLAIIQKVIVCTQKKIPQPIVTEVKPLQNYYLAEEYHQKYLEKNPTGYCHLDLSTRFPRKFKINPTNYQKPSPDTLRKNLSPQQYNVTQKEQTEPPFTNEYWDNQQKGIYVDIVSGEPLFVSTDKFISDSGWPSFSKPINGEVLTEKTDHSHGMSRTEVRSRIGDSHLGHVFGDGPREKGGRRYCINSAALKFIPLPEMQETGYAEFIPFVK